MNPTNSAEALSQLQQTQATAQDPNTILSGQRQQLGVNAANDTVTGLRGAINNTTNLLKQVAPSVMGRTQNSLVTNAQATRQIGNESAPIQQSLEDQGVKYNQASEDAGRLESQATQAAQGIYQGQQDKQSYLQNLYGILYGKERDITKDAEAAAAAAEAKREFDAQLAASRAAASAGSFNLTGAASSATKAATPASTAANKNLTGAQQQTAYNEVKNLLTSKDGGWIQKNITGIQKSAANGNAYDAYKLQVLSGLAKQLPNSSGLNISNLILAGPTSTSRSLSF